MTFGWKILWCQINISTRCFFAFVFIALIFAFMLVIETGLLCLVKASLCTLSTRFFFFWLVSFLKLLWILCMQCDHIITCYPNSAQLSSRPQNKNNCTFTIAFSDIIFLFMLTTFGFTNDFVFTSPACFIFLLFCPSGLFSSRLKYMQMRGKSANKIGT